MQDRVALPRILQVLAILHVVGCHADVTLGDEQEKVEEVSKDGDQLGVDRRHVAEASEPVAERRERRVVAVIVATASRAAAA